MPTVSERPELDARKRTILKAIVQGYVRSGEPVGSKRIVAEHDLGVSAATVRSDMVALEEAGLIEQPHTSAGRIPTDHGYRYFVETLAEHAELTPEQRTALEGLLVDSHDVEDLLRRASSVLSRVTRFAALVATPRLDHSRLRHVELVPLGAHSVLAVLIADTGRVEKRMLDLADPVAEQEVQRVGHAVNEAAAGVRLDHAREIIDGVSSGAPTELRPLLDRVGEALAADLSQPSPSEYVFVGGTANLAGSGYFERLEEVSSVYEALEEQVLLLQLLQEALEAGDPAVRIGEELPLGLDACAMVVAGYEAAGDAAGSIGVLGPSRMDYPRTLGAVQAVADSVEKALVELTGGPSTS
ncbi:heat-inducible transcription repressor HrcA [Egibacter rhizosphaerae]|uniref:Heat-inducible transcription repressor HrcA n=1 Tax=Egibacter rhizosphaerae TaxID=1670831 RepID=A0A411YBQ8_9ACTN|nr:heat-inducible transcriptional repressor HrcA [Egibacter rhizosphaerae]QBI18639.1 heat-inducible transcription repressor HrcA [Egibacter rhizosphaerae]